MKFRFLSCVHSGTEWLGVRAAYCIWSRRGISAGEHILSPIARYAEWHVDRIRAKREGYLK